MPARCGGFALLRSTGHLFFGWLMRPLRFPHMSLCSFVEPFIAPIAFACASFGLFGEDALFAHIASISTSDRQYIDTESESPEIDLLFADDEDIDRPASRIDDANRRANVVDRHDYPSPAYPDGVFYSRDVFPDSQNDPHGLCDAHGESGFDPHDVWPVRGTLCYGRFGPRGVPIPQQQEHRALFDSYRVCDYASLESYMAAAEVEDEIPSGF